MKIKGILLVIFLAAAFAAGVCFKDDAVNFYKNLSSGIEAVQKLDLGNTITQVAKQIVTPPPLIVDRGQSKVVLLKSKIIEETNLQRQQNGGLPLLRENSQLNEAASAKANDMFKNQYFEHISPSGEGPGDLAQEYGYKYIVEGENLILGNFSSEKEVVQDWMDSPGHRANILNNRYTEIGVAIIKGLYKGETVWIGVQEFGLPASVCQEPDESLKNKVDSDKMQLDVLSEMIEQKKAELEENKKSPVYKQMIENYNELVGQYNSLAEKVKLIIIQYNQQVNAFNSCVAGA